MPNEKENAAKQNVPISKQTASGVTGAVIGGLVGGPIGALVGGVAGAVAANRSAEGKPVVPEEAVRVAKQAATAVVKKAKPGVSKTVSKITRAAKARPVSAKGQRAGRG